MTMKPIFEIHRIDDSLFDIPLEQFTLTFDDGYIDHYNYFDRCCAIPTKKIYFIVPVWLHKQGWMSIDQVIEMSQHPDVEIGGHGYNHTLLRPMTVSEKIAEIERDTELMCNWFEKHLGHVPKKFCFPFNDRAHGMYEPVLKQYGFTEFYGDERVTPERYLDDFWWKDNNL